MWWSCTAAIRRCRHHPLPCMAIDIILHSSSVSPRSPRRSVRILSFVTIPPLPAVSSFFPQGPVEFTESCPDLYGTDRNAASQSLGLAEVLVMFVSSHTAPCPSPTTPSRKTAIMNRVALSKPRNSASAKVTCSDKRQDAEATRAQSLPTPACCPHATHPQPALAEETLPSLLKQTCRGHGKGACSSHTSLRMRDCRSAPSLCSRGM